MSDTAVPTQTAPPPAPDRPAEDLQVRNAGIVAGGGILLMAAISVFGIFYVGEGLVTEGDAARTVADIRTSDSLFRWGTASLYAVVVLDVVVAWALFRFLSPVSSGLSRLAAWFRLAYAGVFMLAIGQLAGIPDLVGSQEYAAVFTEQQIQGQALLKLDAFGDLWMAGLILFGIHLALVGHLVYRSGYVPRLLGTLLVVAGVGYVLDSIAATVLVRPPGTLTTVTFLGEFLLGLWLLARSGHAAQAVAGRHD